MTAGQDVSRKVAWVLLGLVVLLSVSLLWSVARWQRAERQMQLAEQRLAEVEYARAVAAMQRSIEGLAPPSTSAAVETREHSNILKEGVRQVPAHIDEGMLLDSLQMNPKRVVEESAPIEPLPPRKSR